MNDRAIARWGILILLFSSLACNAFAGRVDTLPPPPANPTPTATSAAPTPLPGLAPTATLPGEIAPEAAEGTVRILVDLNIRSGPGVSYDRVGFLLKGDRAQVVGRDPVGGWWQIVCPPGVDGRSCWVSGGSQFTLLESAE
jgi:uncharacterized protein YgiM (DUF1202 family)